VTPPRDDRPVRLGISAHDIGYLSGQIHLEPHPKELMLRNHV
jgi:hypothetical protein